MSRQLPCKQVIFTFCLRFHKCKFSILFIVFMPDVIVFSTSFTLNSLALLLNPYQYAKVTT